MADKEVPDLATAGTLAGANSIHVVQSGNSRETNFDQITSYIAEPIGAVKAIDTKTDNYTLVITDHGRTLEMNATSGKAFTVPANASVAFALKTYLNLVRYGAGAVTIVGDTGVTINGISAGTVTISDQYGAATIYKRGTNEWVTPNQTAT